MRPLTHNDPRLRGWIIVEAPRGHYQFYPYLYWREKGRLRKEYIPQSELENLKTMMRRERRRSRPTKQKGRVPSAVSKDAKTRMERAMAEFHEMIIKGARFR